MESIKVFFWIRLKEEKKKQEVTVRLAAVAKAISIVLNCKLHLIRFVLLSTLLAILNETKHCTVTWIATR